jgi:hypothetical protein
MVGKMRRRFCWRSSLRTSEVVLTEGGASSGGAGVLRPLADVSHSYRGTAVLVCKSIPGES